MTVQVSVTINFESATTQEATDVINGMGIPAGAMVSSMVNQMLDEASGTVDDEGTITPPSPPEEPPVETPPNGAPA